ncbi:hypothetical protein [Adhaeretor mobilis]|uniref:Uncharacterized protein n=1 Tax=Adhaeretor mobilis TaxID=1930276 RepID=A0A517MXQ9_9BACT|nr:hypothetical protein [Adhaeretor mobilis]QDS99665.1 hypothetical protein HG15A2_29920 [Adhaeretor mobilis]
MRDTHWMSVGMFSLAVAIVGWLGAAQPSYSGQPGTLSSQGNLITYFQEIEGGSTQAILVDPQTRVMSVYYISAQGEEKGKIQLKSVRPLRYDMEMTSFNTGEPLPQEIRNAQDRSR